MQRTYPKTYIVGGAVRDALLGLRASDIDVATEATPAQVKSFLSSVRAVGSGSFFDVGEKFGTVGTVVGRGIRRQTVEITTLRTESGYADHRHPQNISFTKDLAADAGRRDFTVNAIYYDSSAKQLIDFYSGLGDAMAKRLRFVGEAAERITEDPLRVLRAVRIAATLDFSLAPQSVAAINTHKCLIASVSGQRIFAELNKIVTSDEGFKRGIALLLRLKMIEPRIFPEMHSPGAILAALKNFETEDVVLKWAMLFWAVGNTRYVTERMGLPGGLRDEIVYLCEAVTGAAGDLTDDIESRYRRAGDPLSEQLLILTAAVSGSKLSPEQRKAIDRLLLQIPQDRAKISKAYVQGNDVMRLLGIKQGKLVGIVLEAIKFAQLDGRIKTRGQAISFVKKLDIHRY